MGTAFAQPLRASVLSVVLFSTSMPKVKAGNWGEGTEVLSTHHESDSLLGILSISLNLITTYINSPCFTDEQTEAQSGGISAKVTPLLNNRVRIQTYSLARIFPILPWYHPQSPRLRREMRPSPAPSNTPLPTQGWISDPCTLRHQVMTLTAFSGRRSPR